MRIAAVLVAVALLAACRFAHADIGGIAENSNEYMLVQMGINLHADCPHTIPEHQDRPGRWCIWTVKGDPETDEDDYLPIILPSFDDSMGPVWRLGYSTLRIDGTNVIFGDPNAGGWVVSPYRSDSGIGNYIGLTGFYVIGQYRVRDGNIFAQLRLAVVRDQVRLEMVLRNDDSEAHNVGLRHCADSTTDGLIDSVSYPFIPGRGIVMGELSLTGTDIPDYFELYDNPQSPNVALRNTLRLEDATPPDRAAIGWFLNLVGSDWDYTPVPDRVVGDYGWAIWWNPVVLNPGESRTIVTYYGMAAASSSWTSGAGSSVRQDPFTVALQGPRSLPINYNTTVSPDAMLQGNPFKVKAYVYNLYRGITLTNVNVNLTLPSGLELVSGDPTQMITSIPPESEAQPVVWDVKATGRVTGELKYWVSVSGTPGLQKTVSRSVVVPATSATEFKSGWQMVSVPFKFNDPRIEPALSLQPDTYRALAWDPQVVDYRPATTVAPAKAFWLNSSIDRPTATAASDARPLSGAESFRVPLYTGWNQFGNPYLYTIAWGRVKVLGPAQEGPLTIEQAAARNWVRQTVYWWDVGSGEYQYSSARTTDLVPWRGYWVKALQPCELIIPQVEQIGGGIGGSVTRSRLTDTASAGASKGDGWRLKLVARAGSAVDSRSLLGIDSRASDAYDPADIERPPPPQDYVAINFTHRDWGPNSGSYLTDVRRSTSGEQTWEFEVSSDLANTDVVLTWPTIMEVPKDYSLKLVDVDGSMTRYMRTTSSYRYSTGSGGPRRFRIVAEPGASGRLLVTGLTVNTSRALGSATISYNLSADAAADIRIKSIAGRMVRNLAQGKGVTRGISNTTWNYRDDVGNPVPAGSYLLEVVATTPEGEVAKAIRPFLVAR